jgi:hypothetical protein
MPSAQAGWAWLWWIIAAVFALAWIRRSVIWSRRPHHSRRLRARHLGRSAAVGMANTEAEARLEMVDRLDARVSELENRLDFAERVLMERAQSDRAGDS